MWKNDTTILAIVHKWVKVLGLRSWSFKVDIHYDKKRADTEHRHLMGAAWADHGHKRAEITLNVYNNKTFEELNDTVLHELIHVIQRPLETLAGCYTDHPNQKGARIAGKRASEKAVCALTRAMIRLEKQGKKKK